ncbi:Cytochrome b-c1 complex subunit 10, fungi [Ceraceosorus bombacis]|uniref:Cytochrome b-c1 complex subunit 10, fungi n=2 Tax=Ceraceosorus TaxID=401624 RepID=A0A0N7L9Y2_9BASI|nr:hypothetical protein IE81DRAFT_365178 [Ceraceosorus guamensis]PWN44215.1 hypothetical protein IE81DRAFT_365178 [Ceraceosorus guamensis]CEH15058.1 Cytochrome b-c1 complex subunit 10, fungi [Ceraceosorus bombacis]
MIPTLAARSAFRASARAQAVKYSFQPHVGRFAPENVIKWVPSLALWGAGAGAAVTLFLSGVPLFQTDVLKKLPVLKEYYEDKTPDSDKPF